jgi:outer membrane protein OmpA-like peptidoglycan-associated protein
MAWVMGLALLLNAMAGDLDFGYSPSLSRGDRPMFSVIPNRGVAHLIVRITAGDQTYDFERRGLPGGREERFYWTRDESVTEALVYIRAVFEDKYVAEVEMPVSYSYGGQLQVDLSRAVADRTTQTLTVPVSGPVLRAEVTALGAHKRVLDQRTVAVQGGPGPVNIRWMGDPDEVVLLDVKLYGQRAWVGFSYSPWMLDIPHDDVRFETGRAEILPDEEWKLEAVMTRLKDVLEKYGSVVPVKLYIAGCTDTVGTRGANAVLSEQRAMAIAGWFRQHGYASPVFFHGFGETWLAVRTADEVDSAANRRAVYIVAANPPPASAGVPAARWTGLR